MAVSKINGSHGTWVIGTGMLQPAGIMARQEVMKCSDWLEVVLQHQYLPNLTFWARTIFVAYRNEVFR